MSASRLDGLRRGNLARILALLREDGPASRASLTARTGLNRSTIADLVSALAARSLVREGPPAPSKRVGRPSPVVAVDDRVVCIAANPEIDGVELAAVALDQSVLARHRVELDRPPSPADVAALIGTQLRAWRSGPLSTRDLTAIGIAVPGLVRADDGLVRDAPHLQWRDVPLAALVEDATGLRTAVSNDASCGAVAEWLFGAGRGESHIVYLNGGASGIGGGLILAGSVMTGSGGYAGEFGQNRPGIADPADRRAEHGVLEDEVSRSRLLQAAGLGAANDAVLAARMAADDASRELRSEIARQRRILSTAIANAANVLNPDVVILGGFLALLAQHDRPAFERAVADQTMPACAEGLRIRPASLASDRLLVGAAEAGFADLLADPLSVLTRRTA